MNSSLSMFIRLFTRLEPLPDFLALEMGPKGNNFYHHPRWEGPAGISETTNSNNDKIGCYNAFFANVQNILELKQTHVLEDLTHQRFYTSPVVVWDF